MVGKLYHIFIGSEKLLKEISEGLALCEIDGFAGTYALLYRTDGIPASQIVVDSPLVITKAVILLKMRVRYPVRAVARICISGP